MQKIDGNNLVLFASEKPSIWSDLVGEKVIHKSLGRGTIVNVELEPIYIDIKFDDRTLTFNSDSIRNGMISVEVDASIVATISEWSIEKAKKERERVEREAKEQARKEELERIRLQAEATFSPLTNKYNAPTELLFENNSISPLGAILEKLERGNRCEFGEIEWLEKKAVNRVLATIYFRDYKRTSDPWGLVKACKFLRRANLPGKVVEITEDIKPESIVNKKALGAVWTTRGGALRDLDNLGLAKKSASDAIQVSPTSFHPHTLMGAIYYQEGNPAKGDEHFTEADRLGATARDRHYEIRRVLDRSTPDARQKVIDYLISKNPEKYSWVRQFEGQV